MRRGVRLKGATVVITGASSGIGRAAARRFAEKGANVVLAARGEESLRAAVAECEEAGGRAMAVPTDVADRDAVRNLARRAVDEHGRIDVWVNNAAVMAYGEIDQVPSHVVDRVIDVNLLGQIHGAREALPVMKRQRKGVIINVASLYARMTSPYVSSYATSKFGVLGFSQVLRQELKHERGIHVCTLMPGSLDTPIFRHAANYTGRNVKPPPPVSAPERAVREIVRRAKHPKRRVVVGQSHRLASWGKILFARVYDEIVPYAIRISALGHGRVPDTEGNVFVPQPRLDAVKGGWRRPLRRTATGTGVATLLVAGAVALSGRRGSTTARKRRPRCARTVKVRR